MTLSIFLGGVGKAPETKESSWELPGDLVVGIQQFHCHNLGSIPHQETEILQATQHSQTKNKTQKNLFLISWCLKKKSLNSMSSCESFFFDCPTHLLSPFRSEAWVLEFWKYKLFNNLLPSIFLFFFFFPLLELSIYYTSWIYFYKKKIDIYLFFSFFMFFCLFVLLSGKFLDWSSKWSIDFIISTTVFLNFKSSYFLTVPF